MPYELAERARRGDREAFAGLVDASIARLYAIAHLITRDADQAHDAVQEAYIAAWRDIRSLRDADRVDGWLRRLVVRACYRQSRIAARRRVVEVRVVTSMNAVAAGHELAVAERDLIDRGFARLEPEHRAVLVLRHYLDLPMAEVADSLEIPIGTAKSRLARATDAMRAALDADNRASRLLEAETA